MVQYGLSAKSSGDFPGKTTDGTIIFYKKYVQNLQKILKKKTRIQLISKCHASVLRYFRGNG